MKKPARKIRAGVDCVNLTKSYLVTRRRPKKPRPRSPTPMRERVIGSGTCTKLSENEVNSLPDGTLMSLKMKIRGRVVEAARGHRAGARSGREHCQLLIGLRRSAGAAQDGNLVERLSAGALSSGRICAAQRHVDAADSTGDFKSNVKILSRTDGSSVRIESQNHITGRSEYRTGKIQCLTGRSATGIGDQEVAKVKPVTTQRSRCQLHHRRWRAELPAAAAGRKQ